MAQKAHLQDRKIKEPTDLKDILKKRHSKHRSLDESTCNIPTWVVPYRFGHAQPPISLLFYPKFTDFICSELPGLNLGPPSSNVAKFVLEVTQAGRRTFVTLIFAGPAHAGNVTDRSKDILIDTIRKLASLSSSNGADLAESFVMGPQCETPARQFDPPLLQHGVTY